VISGFIANNPAAETLPGDEDCCILTRAEIGRTITPFILNSLQGDMDVTLK
jgi:hypothetical protein